MKSGLPGMMFPVNALGLLGGTYAGEGGTYAGEVGTYAGEVGLYAGEDGLYAGEVGLYAGELRLSAGERTCGESNGEVGTSVGVDRTCNPRLLLLAGDSGYWFRGLLEGLRHVDDSKKLRSRFVGFSVSGVSGFVRSTTSIARSMTSPTRSSPSVRSTISYTITAIVVCVCVARFVYGMILRNGLIRATQGFTVQVLFPF